MKQEKLITIFDNASLLTNGIGGFLREGTFINPLFMPSPPPNPPEEKSYEK